nr:efflux RND transporter permease subunit [Desulfosoma caldarium]
MAPICFSKCRARLFGRPIRVRPILMTQLTTVLVLIPVAVNLGEGDDMLRPMAIAEIGRLFYSLTLTCFFLTTAYGLSFGGGTCPSPRPRSSAD